MKLKENKNAINANNILHADGNRYNFEIQAGDAMVFNKCIHAFDLHNGNQKSSYVLMSGNPTRDDIIKYTNTLLNIAGMGTIFMFKGKPFIGKLVRKYIVGKVIDTVEIYIDDLNHQNAKYYCVTDDPITFAWDGTIKLT